MALPRDPNNSGLGRVKSNKGQAHRFTKNDLPTDQLAQEIYRTLVNNKSSRNVQGAVNLAPKIIEKQYSTSSPAGLLIDTAVAIGTTWEFTVLADSVLKIWMYISGLLTNTGDSQWKFYVKLDGVDYDDNDHLLVGGSGGGVTTISGCRMITLPVRRGTHYMNWYGVRVTGGSQLNLSTAGSNIVTEIVRLDDADIVLQL